MVVVVGVTGGRILAGILKRGSQPFYGKGLSEDSW